MTKYYIGYSQGENDYVYISNINKTVIGVTVVNEDAISFENEQMAKNILEYIKTQVANQEYKVLKITVTVEEVDVDVTTSE
jgi:hypothetical protein